jgi:hypothetical protein
MGAPPKGWGPEVEFAIDFRAAHPSDTLYIVKSVFGGTALAQDTTANHADWSPQSGGELFDQTSQLIAQASAAAGGLAPRAVFFGQGEEDANSSAAANAYGDNLAAFFTAVRSQWLHDANGKIGYFQIGTSPPYSSAVRAGEQRVDQADPNATSFDAAGFPLQPDGLHFAGRRAEHRGRRLLPTAAGLAERRRRGGGGTAGQVITSPGPARRSTAGRGTTP